MAKLALVARLVAKPGKEEEVSAFLTGALPLAQKEAATLVWFALRFSKSRVRHLRRLSGRGGSHGPPHGPHRRSPDGKGGPALRGTRRASSASDVLAAKLA